MLPRSFTVHGRFRASRSLKLAGLIVLLALGFVRQAKAQRVAIWDPEHGTSEPPNRLTLDLPRLHQVGDWLTGAGITPQWVTASQMEDPTAFSAAQFDVLVMTGDSFPEQDVPALTKFEDGGGILIALNGRIPFNARIVPKPDGSWDLSPNIGFDWQSTEVMNLIGVQYIFDAAKLDQGVHHSVTPLLKSYVPDAPDIPDQTLTSMWLVPMTETKAAFYPLIRSRRVDGADVTPQIFVSRAGKHTAIISLSSDWTEGTNPDLWTVAKETAVGLVKLALDLKAGKADLSAPIDLPADLPSPEPLQTRTVSGEVTPEGAVPLWRWGRFDGSSTEFGAPLGPGEAKTFPANTPSAQLPRYLAGGAALSLSLDKGLPPNEPVYLRFRGAYASSNAGLKVSLGGKVIWDELLSVPAAGGAGNFSVDLSGTPVEFDRAVYVPSGSQGPLEVSNPGREPLYIDAFQLETRPNPAPTYQLGAMMTDLAGATIAPAPSLTKLWGAVRCNVRTQYVGPPGAPDRWDHMDKLMAYYESSGAPIQLLFEGTPEWCAISPERYQAGVKAGRSADVPPDPVKYAKLAEEVIGRYGSHVATYEIWNEMDGQQFWRGTAAEYCTFFHDVADVIRRTQPGKPIISGGLAGFREAAVHDFLAGHVFSDADIVAYHPYNGQSTGWDASFELFEGRLFSAGLNKPLYCDESGFVSKPEEWFKDPAWSPRLQAEATSAAMGRLFADGLTKFAIFHATGSNTGFDLFDVKGNPKPAYAVFSDYLQLNGGQREDVALAPAGTSPVQNVYAAAALHPDGSSTLILNASTSGVWTQDVVATLPVKGRSATAHNEWGPVPVGVKPGSDEVELRLPVTGRTVVVISP